MSVALVGVAFNHGEGDSAAVTLRHNRTRSVQVPEWHAARPAEAVACYALDRLAATPVTLRVHLRRRAPVARIEIRALAAQPPRLPAWWWATTIEPALAWPSSEALAYWQALYLALAALEQTPSAPPTAFGELSPHEVTFGPNEEAQETIAVASSALGAHGVDAHTVRWRWQYRRHATDPWTDFALTRFRIYTVLRMPSLPWVQAPNDPRNTQLPWADVLEVACRWAAGAATVEQAATRVTAAVFALGDAGILAYDCVGPDAFHLGTPHYTLLPGFFDCSEFLERVHGGFGNGPFVNCSDCAAAVSTFANALGCDLSQARMFGPLPFPLNPTRSIGSRDWHSACGSGTYTMHEVAWTGACSEDDHVYDACLQVDGDRDPSRPPHTPRLPAHLRFGAPGEGLYRDRLAAPTGRLLCDPQPHTRQRRFVM